MKLYTYSSARQRLAKVLEEASRDGVVQIRRQGWYAGRARFRVLVGVAYYLEEAYEMNEARFTLR